MLTVHVENEVHTRVGGNQGVGSLDVLDRRVDGGSQGMAGHAEGKGTSRDDGGLELHLVDENQGSVGGFVNGVRCVSLVWD